MTKLLNQRAVLVCTHEVGIVGIVAGQSLVRLDGAHALVRPDPEARPIAGCPNVGPTIKPCTSTLPVQAGYSEFVRIEGKAACLDTVTGLTDGTPPGGVKYKVNSPGQTLVSEA